jgi:hypothetical protein
VSDLMVKIRDAFRRPLDDRIDLEVEEQRTGHRVARLLDISGRRTVRVAGVVAGAAYVVRVFPFRHRARTQSVVASQASETPVELACPLHPDRVNKLTFSDFDSLAPNLRRALTASSAVEGFPGTSGKGLYEGLPDSSRAGLLNIFAKLEHTQLDGGGGVADHVAGLYRVRGDRVFADVGVPLRDLVKNEVVSGRFSKVSGSLHTPPPGFHDAGSFKTNDPFGNLQITFFASDGAPLAFKADIDIDDAQGLAHGFQVLRNWVCDVATHPFDIYQILVYHQGIVPAYALE